MAIKRMISVEVDVCPGCNGIVLDKGETEVIEALGIASVLERTLPRGDASPARGPTATCHPCGKPMTALVGAGDVEFDWCDSCERLYFDRGELSAIEAFQND